MPRATDFRFQVSGFWFQVCSPPGFPFAPLRRLVTFFVRKQLALGPIRFGVTPRVAEETIDADPALSTGAAGEFVRRRAKGGFFFGSQARFDEPVVPVAPSITSTPFLSSLKPDGTARGYGFLGLMGLGALLVLLGLAVVARKGPQGWVEIILGLAFIAIPIVLTAQQRKTIREREERERVAREAEEKRNRELLAAYIAALARLRDARDDAALANLAKEREALTLPYGIWGNAARRLILLIGFDELSKRGVAAAPQISDFMTKASTAAGLTAEDAIATKRDLYATIVWHLLADDRIGAAQLKELDALRSALGIGSDDVPAETKAEEQFHRLRGINSRNLPRVGSAAKLAFQEYAILDVDGTSNGKPAHLTVTNRRMIVEAKKRIEVALPRVNDVDVDIDADVMSIDTAETKKPIALTVADPIYTAAIVDLAAGIDERPRWQ